MLLNFHIFISFPIFLLLLTYSFIPLQSKKKLGMISTLDLIMVVLWPDMCLFWKISHLYLGKTCTLLLLSGMFCICLLGQLVYSVVQIWCFHIDFSVWYCLNWGIEVTYYYCISFSFVSFVNIYFVYLCALMLGTYIKAYIHL